MKNCSFIPKIPAYLFSTLFQFLELREKKRKKEKKKVFYFVEETVKNSVSDLS